MPLQLVLRAYQINIPVFKLNLKKILILIKFNRILPVTLNKVWHKAMRRDSWNFSGEAVAPVAKAASKPVTVVPFYLNIVIVYCWYILIHLSYLYLSPR